MMRLRLRSVTGVVEKYERWLSEAEISRWLSGAEAVDSDFDFAQSPVWLKNLNGG